MPEIDRHLRGVNINRLLPMPGPTTSKTMSNTVSSSKPLLAFPTAGFEAGYAERGLLPYVSRVTCHGKLGFAPFCSEGAKAGRALDLGTGTRLWPSSDQHPETELTALRKTGCIRSNSATAISDS
ncbi:hypothetical protein CTA2_5175 [Colletotrichum tanaceti]|nr:hypothetical protein CTA2_5186 [Colletotrichum tanaceti]KAJ0168522.1 hypothetical protein CTA2_5175 [Colletotrichum tanaceti]